MKTIYSWPLFDKRRILNYAVIGFANQLFYVNFSLVIVTSLSGPRVYGTY